MIKVMTLFCDIHGPLAVYVSISCMSLDICKPILYVYTLLSGSLALVALLIGVHCKKRYINV